MNAYTVEPPKSESAAANAPSSIPGMPPFYMPPNYQYYPYQQPSPLPPPPPPPAPVAPVVTPNTDAGKIRDWLAWSIISLFLGGLIPGFLPLVFTLVCRSKKRKNDLNGARTMSTLALVFNIICTILGVAGIIGIFIYLFIYTRTMSNLE